MPGGLHHVVHVVRDLDAAGECYRRLGFQVGGRNRHPWGTHNRVIQFGGSYIELLTVAEPEKIRARGERDISFGALTRDFLARGEGLAMVALESRDATADAAAYKAAGIGDFDVFHFEREGTGPQGAPVKVAFSLAFAQDGDAPQAAFFACQEHFPENFWNPAVQAHANTASGISGVVLVADEPERHRNFLLAFAGLPDAENDADGLTVTTTRGSIQVMKPGAFRARFGVMPPDVWRGMRLAAIRFAVADASLMQAAPELAGIAGLYAGNAAAIGPEDAMGAVLVFEPGR
jgi:catechol 2,3-dioxygenase-like lactoylglutathione lyase family enzyme